MSDIVDITETLDIEKVVAGYRKGVFPMGREKPGVISWHHPDPRAIMPLDDGFHISRSLALVLRQHKYTVTYDQAFLQVMKACAHRPGVWITPEFYNIYGQLHSQGQAHSVEIWVDGELAGGTYGVHLGAAFFAESKFHRRANMSKVAVAELVFRLRERGFRLLEVQYLTEHLTQFGVIEIPDREYQKRLRLALRQQCSFPLPTPC